MGFASKELDRGWNYLFDINDITNLLLRKKDFFLELCVLGPSIMDEKLTINGNLLAEDFHETHWNNLTNHAKKSIFIRALCNKVLIVIIIIIIDIIITIIIIIILINIIIIIIIIITIIISIGINRSGKCIRR